MINHFTPSFHHSRCERSEPGFLLSAPGKIGQMKNITKIGILYMPYVDMRF